MTYDRVERDQRDEQLFADRIAALAGIKGPRVGDFVVFADGVTRRVSHDWGDGVQTSDAGSWYLGTGYVSFSGGLYETVPKHTLQRVSHGDGTPEVWDAPCWLFHHDVWGAGRGVSCRVPWRVYLCSEVAPS